MPVEYGKGDKAKATKLHSQIVRLRGQCERCGSKERLQCAHIISRQYSMTRTREDNAFCLCSRCHWFFNKWPVEFGLFVEEKIGIEDYVGLKIIATSGGKMDWTKELQRLQEVWKCRS